MRGGGGGGWGLIEQGFELFFLSDQGRVVKDIGDVVIDHWAIGLGMIEYVKLATRLDLMLHLYTDMEHPDIYSPAQTQYTQTHTYRGQAQKV